MDGAKCTTNKDCKAGTSLPLGSGFMTGKCVAMEGSMTVKTCEVEAWCPTERDVVPLYENVLFANFTSSKIVVQSHYS